MEVVNCIRVCTMITSKESYDVLKKKMRSTPNRAGFTA